MTSAVPIESADDLRARIRDLSADEPDPAVIAEKILPALSPAEAYVVASVALVDFVRKTLHRAPAAPVQTFETAGGARTTSSKVAAIRDWVARELRLSVCVDEAGSEWKFLADCTAPDLAATAAMRRRKAAATVAEAERFERVAAAVETAGVDTVRELPRVTLEAVLAR